MTGSLVMEAKEGGLFDIIVEVSVFIQSTDVIIRYSTYPLCAFVLEFSG